MPIESEEYLGDAVYASFDGHQIRLRCAAPPCVIYLEPGVLSAFDAYRKRLDRAIAKIMAPAEKKDDDT